jgi:hypothetical protein
MLRYFRPLSQTRKARVASVSRPSGAARQGYVTDDIEDRVGQRRRRGMESRALFDGESGSWRQKSKSPIYQNDIFLILNDW